MEPFRLQVGPAIYSVRAVVDLRAQEGQKIDGEVRHGAEEIEVEQALPLRTHRVTVVHEMIHSILQQAGQYEHYKNEGLLDALAYGLVGAKVNPGAVTGRAEPVLGALFNAMEMGDPCPTE